jgi:hypothetical protein
MDLLTSRKTAAFCKLTLLGALVVAACSSDRQSTNAGAGTSGPMGGATATGAMTGPNLAASNGTGTPPTVDSRAGQGGSNKPSGTAGSPSTAAAGTIAAAGSRAASTAGAMAISAGAGGAAVAAGSSGAAGMAPATAVCDPKDKTPAPMPSSFKVIVGYDTLMKEPTTGPLKPVIEVHSGFPEWTVYRPETVGPETKHPIVIWGEGGCLQNGTLYGQWLLELASYGVIAIADGKPAASASSDPAANGIRPGPDAKPMMMAIDWITAENARPCSPFYQKLAVDKIGIGGQSCGGMMTLLSAGDKRVATAMVFNSGLSSGDATLFGSYHAPMLFLAGGSSDFLSTSATANVRAITTVPIWYGNLNVGHAGTWDQANGGEMGRVATGWVRWKLLGDSGLEKMFVGADCELCKSPSMWMMIQKKMIE